MAEPNRYQREFSLVYANPIGSSAKFRFVAQSIIYEKVTGGTRNDHSLFSPIELGSSDSDSLFAFIAYN